MHQCHFPIITAYICHINTSFSGTTVQSGSLCVMIENNVNVYFRHPLCYESVAAMLMQQCSICFVTTI